MRFKSENCNCYSWWGEEKGLVSFLCVGWVVGEDLVVYNGRDLFTQIL